MKNFAGSVTLSYPAAGAFGRLRVWVYREMRLFRVYCECVFTTKDTKSTKVSEIYVIINFVTFVPSWCNLFLLFGCGYAALGSSW